jgi:hypothetical protein
MAAALRLIAPDATPSQVDWPRRETSGAVWADVVQFVLDAVRTECALVAAMRASVDAGGKSTSQNSQFGRGSNAMANSRGDF